MKKIFKKISPKTVDYFFAFLTCIFLALFVIAQVNAHNYRYQWQTCICKYNQVIDGEEIYKIKNNNDGHLNGKVRVQFDTKGTLKRTDDTIEEIYLVSSIEEMTMDIEIYDSFH